jgi:hypothetical protein
MVLEGPVEFHSGHFITSWSYTFRKPGVYVYICPIHPYMKGVIGVGEKVPKEKIPSWVKEWPPAAAEAPAGLPAEAGKGEIWLDAQFHKVAGKEKPGTVIIINAETWEVEAVLDDESLNNPHNLWEAGGKILVTNWFDKTISIFDKYTRNFEKTVLLGDSPAHVHAHDSDNIYVTIQGGDTFAILGRNFDYVKEIRTPTGPHGHWVSSDGKIMALASTEEAMITVWNLENNSILFKEVLNGDEEDMKESVFEDHPHTLPLMAGVTNDGKHAFAATSAGGKFYVFDVEKKELIKSFDVGPSPIQTVPSPDGKYVAVPLTGSGELAVISTESWDIAEKIENVGYGAHGVYFGEKQGGGWYAYVSNKFTTWVTVVDMDTLQIAGYIPLPKDAWGGQGILVVEK